MSVALFIFCFWRHFINIHFCNGPHTLPLTLEFSIHAGSFVSSGRRFEHTHTHPSYWHSFAFNPVNRNKWLTKRKGDTWAFRHIYWHDGPVLKRDEDNKAITESKQQTRVRLSVNQLVGGEARKEVKGLTLKCGGQNFTVKLKRDLFAIVSANSNQELIQGAKPAPCISGISVS